jgi:hypothetical protein
MTRGQGRVNGWGLGGGGAKQPETRDGVIGSCRPRVMQGGTEVRVGAGAKLEVRGF